jgi:polyhydroxybutyrate depolymerase
LCAASLLAQPQPRSRPRQRARAATDVAAAAEPGKRLQRIDVDGKMREFVVYRPQAIGDKPAPVVFMFHGTGGNGEKFYAISGWKEKADAAGIVAVFPSALRYRLFDDEMVIKGQVRRDVSQFTTKWSFYGLQKLLDPKYDPQPVQDDVEFVRAIVAELRRDHSVDPRRFYATGFSNGAQFTARLAAEMPDVFAAYALVGAGGGIPAAVPAPSRPRPLTLVLGETDPKLAHGLGVPSFPLDESALAPGTRLKEQVVAVHLKLLGLEDAYTYRNTGRVASFRFGQPLPGRASTVYELAILKGMGHVYPNGRNYPWSAADEFWRFFETHRLD